MPDRIKELLEDDFSFRLNSNQFKDIYRLIFEISKRENLSLPVIISSLKNDPGINHAGGRDKFFAIKNALINKRFPETAKQEKIEAKNVYLTKVKTPIRDTFPHGKEFNPEKIFVEKEARGSYLEKRFVAKFPGTPVEELAYYSHYLKTNRFRLAELKKPIVFIVKERWDFIKPCPCTKKHLNCGYWILNLGFGCPFDCSYCFLQHYSNFPGITLPANLEDFFAAFPSFIKKVKTPLRIGTGEFCDSLALDDITGYSLPLIDFFKDKNVFFELKTKSDKISNLLESPHTPENIIISWSLNPQSIIEKEDIGAVSLSARFAAAEKIRKKGFSLAFHFDPIIHSAGWEKEYEEVVNELYSRLNPPFKWISLGTLRSSRDLKPIVEQRFPESKIFYGELFMGEDKKLRYPEFIRKDIYSKMIRWIREHDSHTPVYLCMESINMWETVKKITPGLKISDYIMGL